MLREENRKSHIKRAVMAAVLAGAMAPLAALAAESPFLLRDTAIIDPAHGAAYVATPGGTVDAVDLSAGRTLWTSAEAAVPLGIDQGLVVAQSEEKPLPTEKFKIVVLDAANGGKVSEATVMLPDGVRALVEDEIGKSFRATAEREGALFVVSWLYSDFEVRGKAPSENEKPALHFYAGSVRLDPRSGKVINASGGELTGPPARWKRYGAPPQQPWQSGTVSARAEGGRGGPLVLKRTDAASGRALPDQTLSAHALVDVASYDQAHLLVSERVGGGGPDDPEYHWIVYAVETGERISELRRDVSAAPFFVFGDSIVLTSQPRTYIRGDVRVDEPLQLQAFRLSSGVPKWNVELRDLSNHHPLPPHRRR
jgi:hypothetical protein